MFIEKKYEEDGQGEYLYGQAIGEKETGDQEIGEQANFGANYWGVIEKKNTLKMNDNYFSLKLRPHVMKLCRLA